jgi:hypothetical protein
MPRALKTQPIIVTVGALATSLALATACDSNLTVRDVIEPATCGNADVEGDEECDYGLNNGNPGACCRKDCTLVPACKPGGGSGGSGGCCP